MSDPEKIIHKRVWKERKSVRAEIPENAVEDYPSSSSQEIPLENPDSAEENPEYYSDIPPRGSARTKENLHLTPRPKKLNKSQK